MRIFAYDLDGTLADSKSPIKPEIIGLFSKLIEHNIGIAIISGCKLGQFRTQIIDQLSGPEESIADKIHFFPTSGNAWYCYRLHMADWRDHPIKIYENIIPEEDRAEIIYELVAAVAESGYEVKETYGPTIEDRLTQITYSALGQQAPLELKKTWDPTAEKRRKIKSILEKTITEYDINYGGTTSLDITYKGIDKAYAIDKLIEYKLCRKDELTFFGDALQPGGNDYPARKTGVKCIEVTDPHDTIAKSLTEAGL